MILPAISIRQPWAALIVLGHKDVENRTWCCPTKYFQRQVLIHAGKAKCPWEPGCPRRGSSMPVHQAALLTYKGIIGKSLDLAADAPGLGLGGIVGVATIIACFRSHHGYWPSPWAEPGMWAWMMADARPLPFFACSGRLGFFTVDYPHSFQVAA